MPATFCLRLHASYGCRHSGVCCSTDWLIPAEPHVLQVVSARRITSLDGSNTLFLPDPSGAHPVVARRPDGTCIFFNRDGRRLCVIHGVAGAAALPSACRHFPREILEDARGTFISLSHYCPTAAALLLDSDPRQGLIIDEAARPLAIDGPLESMDATAALPPLLCPGVLSDLEGYAAWEGECLATLASPGQGYHAAAGVIAAATDDIRGWRPGDVPLSARVASAFARARADRPRRPADDGEFSTPMVAGAPWFQNAAARLFPASLAPPPALDEVWRTLVAPSLPAFDPAIRNYLGARLFANWVGHQGRGWRTIVAWLCTALGVVESELARRCARSGRGPGRDDFIAAVGAADLLLLHTIDSEDVARHFAPSEGREPA